VRLTDASASNDHASVFWTGERWEARDLASTNGTSVNDVPVPQRENVPLARGAVLRFGCDAERWELIDDRGPVVVARSLTTGEIRTAEDGLLALPDTDDVLVSIVLDSTRQWVVERPDGSRREARNTEQLLVGDQIWELAVPPPYPVTGTYKAKPSPSLATLTLHFHVSRDEEHVRIEVVDGETVLHFKERTGFYMLLVLARERLNDAARASLSEAEQGWVHVADLTRDLRVDESSLNVHVYRVRDALKALVQGAEGIVQRRPKQLRIGTGRLEEHKA
jgi:FHA domain